MSAETVPASVAPTFTTTPDAVPHEDITTAAAGAAHDTMTTAAAISLLTRQMAEFDTRLGSIEGMLKSRKQWITWAGWLAAAGLGALAQGGDKASMLHTFVQLLSAGAAGSP